jgi:hypothetical protein
VHLESEKLALFPRSCLARDEDGVVKTGANVVSLESIYSLGVNGWLRGCSCGTGAVVETARGN